ncbi:uncharacterized protein LOC123678918 isoform X2 [Harmonia axyridis]|uniref:uncharacterized protein LOC123678918 isoform X2 n=1 Tax=Harmonia axyridis TaxID=115357 RepID=UPI001E2750C4|nr:uncharacterized protein LOC123678918 isoform X2 [Harmonia axyridis]
MNVELIGEGIKTLYIIKKNPAESEADVPLSSDGEIEDDKPLSHEEFGVNCLEKSFGTNYFPFSYYRHDDEDLTSSDFSPELDLNTVQESLKYDLEKDSKSDEEYRNSVWHRLSTLMEGDYVEQLKAIFRKKRPTFQLETTLELLNYLLLADIRILIYGVISLADVLQYLEENPVQLMDPAFSAFRKTMQIIMRNCDFLEDSERIKILLLLNRDRTIIEKLELRATKHFIVNLLTFTPKFCSVPEGVSFEEILQIIHGIYLEYMHKSDIIEGITSLETTNVLHKVLRNTNAIIPVKHCVMEILSIICANNMQAASNLLGNNIHLTLIDLDQQYKFKIEAVKMHLVTLIWSLLPCLSRIYLFKLNDDVREETFKTANVIKMAVWHIGVKKDSRVPFIPRLNYLIEQSYRENVKEFTYYDDEEMKTLDFTRMCIIDESTAKGLPVSREEIEIHRPLFLKKSRKLEGFHFKNRDFIDFSYKFLTRRFSLTLYKQEKYYCMEALLSVLELMNYEQHDKLLCCAEPEEYVWRADQLVQIMVTLLKQHPMYCQMFAVQTLSYLAYAHGLSYEKIFDVYGIGILLKKFSEEKEQLKRIHVSGMERLSSLEYEFVNWTINQVEEYTKYYNLGNTRYPNYVGSNISNSYGGLTETKQELEYYKASFFDEVTSDILKRRSEAIKYFIWYLTGPTESDHRICRMRVFLDVFFGIPVQPQGQEFNFNSLLFKAMILVRCSPPNRDVELNVRPFMTIQNLLQFMYNESCHHPNKRFATKFTLSFNGIVLSPQMTIYEVIRKYAIIRKGAFNQKNVFLYRQYEAPLPSNEENNLDLNEEFMKHTYVLENYLQPRSSECEELTEEVKNALHLSNILYGINKHWTTAYEHIQHQNVLIDPRYFTNEDLTESVFHRLLDPFAALIGKYPPWIKYIVDNCPFVFPLRMRRLVFKVLSLDRIRALYSILGQYSKYSSSVVIYERHTRPLMVDRSNMVNDVKEYLLHTRPSSFLKVIFKNEIGEGRGLITELFNSIGKELQKDKYNIWTSTEETLNGFVQFNEGLYPKLEFCSHLDFYDESSSNGADIFITIGAIMAKALMEFSLFELPLATPIFKYLLNKQCLNFDDLKYVHPAVHKVLGYIRQLITEREKILDDNELTDSEKSSLIKDLTINGDSLESYNLNFVFPGHEEIELIPDGANTSVDIMNAHIYVDAIMKKLFVGVQKQMSALKWGFDHVIKLSKLNMFEPEELKHIIFGKEDDTSYWTYENLIKYVQLEDCTVDDIEIQHLFGILSSAKKETRRNFLEFVTGRSRLPMGGFAVLNPPLTIYIYEGYPAAHTCFHRFDLKRGMVHCELKKFIEDIIPESLNYFGLV